MSLNRFLVIFLVTLASCLATIAGHHHRWHQSEPEKDHQHERTRRFIYFHSRPHPKAEEERGIGLSGHLANLFKGGALGVEFHWPKNLNKRVEKWGKKLPFLPKDEIKENERARDVKEWETVKREERTAGDYGGLINPRTRP